MTNLKSPSKWAALKTLILTLPFLALLGASVPNALADDHRDRRHHEEYRERHYRHHDGYSGRGEYRRHRHYYYRHGHRYYGYEDAPYYDGPRSGVSVHIGL